MKRIKNPSIRRTGALALALLMTAGLALPAAAAEIAPTCSETYYATLDYYGGLTNSSVVKTYRTNGSTTITDYGAYDHVTNLTDSGQPTVADGTVTFETSDNKFCFEGTTTRPYEEFPWTVGLSYTLNGVPTQAEDLAGKTGVVEITMDAVPNAAASEYSRNNLVLTAMSIFNGDDILSLEAPGAQVQLIGNLYCVLYMVMPGEEQHFTIRVGSDDFTYSGMTFLAVPATLQQLDQITDLRDAKEKMEDSYDAIQDSMDVILNSLDGMSGSLNATASGLDQLNQARGTISNGKGKVYSSLDTALDAAGPLVDSIAPMAGHLATAQQALTDTTALLNDMSANVTGLKPEVENTRKILKSLQSDLDELQELMDDLDDEVGADSLRRVSKDLAKDFDLLGKSVNNLDGGLSDLQSDLKYMKKQAAILDNSDATKITIGGKDLATIEKTIPQVKALHSQYEASGVSSALSFQDFASLYLIYTNSDQLQLAFPDFSAFLTAYLTGAFQLDLTDAKYQTAVDNAKSMDQLWSMSQQPGFDTQLAQLKKVDAALGQYGITVNQMKSALNSGSDLVGDLSGLCTALNGSHLSGDLETLADLMRKACDVVDDHSGALSSAAGTLKDAAELGTRVSANLDTALDQVQSLTNIMNTYEPEAQKALSDAQTFADSASTSISALVDAAKTTEALAKQSGQELDAGTKQALAGLSAALRQSTKGLGQTDTIRNAKNTIDALITDEWDSHTGGDNNMLLMDAAAQPQSLTDSRNQNIASIQYVMRSQEIKVQENDDSSTDTAKKADNGTVWSRITAMFRDFWQMLTGIFKH